MKTALEVVEAGRQAVEATSTAHIQGNVFNIMRVMHQDIELVLAALGNADLEKASNYACWLSSRVACVQNIIDDARHARELAANGVHSIGQNGRRGHDNL